jgi:hypothetical protein
MVPALFLAVMVVVMPVVVMAIFLGARTLVGCPLLYRHGAAAIGARWIRCRQYEACCQNDDPNACPMKHAVRPCED